MALLASGMDQLHFELPQQQQHPPMSAAKPLQIQALSQDVSLAAHYMSQDNGFPSLTRKDSGTQVSNGSVGDFKDLAYRRASDWPVSTDRPPSSGNYSGMDARLGQTPLQRQASQVAISTQLYGSATTMPQQQYQQQTGMTATQTYSELDNAKHMFTFPSQKVCRYFQEGFCSRGDRCYFAHVPVTCSPGARGQPYLRHAINSDTPPAFMSSNPIEQARTQTLVSPATPVAPNMPAPSQFAPSMAAYAQAFYSAPSATPIDLMVQSSALAAAATAAYNQQFASFHTPHGGQRLMTKAQRRYEVEANRYKNYKLEDLIGQIYMLSKDQHGCRFLQKKLEENNPKNTTIICEEVLDHFGELMTDPFGNYLCQKLVEYCTDDERTKIVEQAAPELATVSLNMHGTRAAQKMIECLSNQRQVRAIVSAFNPSVVMLMKDLNGNHVIQRCLSRLEAADNQFIYDAATRHCVEIATHRHGCCVLQRCVDYAADPQKHQLISEISRAALSLVQDPFGNYVVQYVLDLGSAELSDSIVRRFVGHVCVLSMQKFSSNVIEKCIRVAVPEVRRQLIGELVDSSKMESLMRDSYANYVVQTSLDYADPTQRAALIDRIRPILPIIRSTPYGKRIQGKLMREEMMFGDSVLGGDSYATAAS
ncbi:hypothetical protein RI367_000363 [Sorochytrium milnesiophthora]